MGCIINMEMVVAYFFVIGKISPLPLNLVNKSVSRGTILFVMLHYREIVCCLPSFIGQFYRCSPQSDYVRHGWNSWSNRPLQCRQRQQNISLTCAHKAGLSFAKILNWDGQQRRLFYPSWTQSMARKTIKLMSRATEGQAKVGQPITQSFTLNTLINQI